MVLTNTALDPNAAQFGLRDGRAGRMLDADDGSFAEQGARDAGMNRSIAIFIALGFLSMGLFITTLTLVYRLTPEHRRRSMFWWLFSWTIKGLFLPILVWTILNLGISWNLQPFMPEIQWEMNGGGNWLLPFMRVLGYGLFIASSYWMIITLGWSLRKITAGLEGQPRSDFKGLCTTCALGMGIPALGLLYLGGLPILGFAVATILLPIAGYAPAILRKKKSPPMYSRAIARMKFGKYNEAEWEIIRQLERCEDDFNGWMMLAELYAEKFNDLAEAEQTVLEICDQPRTTPSQLSVALHRLSEWHLKLADNPDAAHRCLQMICDRLPGTHLAHMAQLRMNQLPETVEELREQRENRPIPLPDPGEVNAITTVAPSEMQRQQTLDMVNLCVDLLTRDPNDVPARERLARLLVEGLNKVEQGLEQLTLLLNLPDQTDEQRASWLNLMANWQIHYRQDFDAGRKLLERLIREFPQSNEATNARRRIQTLGVEYRG